MRTVYLYFYATQRDYSVIGPPHTEKSDYSTSLYIKYGDGATELDLLLLAMERGYANEKVV